MSLFKDYRQCTYTYYLRNGVIILAPSIILTIVSVNNNSVIEIRDDLGVNLNITIK